MDIRVEQAGPDTMRVVVFGELDMASRKRFLAAVTQAIGTRPGGRPAMIEVNLTEASFLDAAGVGALVDARNAVVAAGQRLRVRGASGLVFQVLEICDVVEFLGAKAT